MRTRIHPLVRQGLGAVALFDKAMTVAKLRLARDRIRKRPFDLATLRPGEAALGAAFDDL